MLACPGSFLGCPKELIVAVGILWHCFPTHVRFTLILVCLNSLLSFIFVSPASLEALALYLRIPSALLLRLLRLPYRYRTFFSGMRPPACCQR